MFAMTIIGYTVTMIWYFALLFLFVLIALWPAAIASRKGRSFWLYFLLSIPFWWITFFVVIFMKDNSTYSAGPSPEA